MASVVFVKRGAVVEAEKPIVQQVRVISLSDGSPYETLHSYVSAAVAPYFKSFVRESGKADRDGDKVCLNIIDPFEPLTTFSEHCISTHRWRPRWRRR